MPATPSNLVVAATSTTTASLFWDVSAVDGTTYDVKRALHSGGLVTIATTAANVTTYDDTGLSAETEYDYEVCRAGSATCTAVASVVTDVCSSGFNLSTEIVQLIRASGNENPSASDFNLLAQQVETSLNQSSSTQDTTCLVCSVNGAVTFDCSKCINFRVNVTEDINSVTLLNCNGVPSGNINFDIPPGSTHKICGWPTGFGNEGSECKDSHSGGNAGNTIGVGFGSSSGGSPNAQPGAGAGTSKPTGGGGGGGGGSLALTCQAAIFGPNPNTFCSIDCAGITNTPKSLRVVASGGSPPYVFSATGGLTITAVNSTTADITPPANTGSGVAGVAYSTHWVSCDGTFRTSDGETFSCNDAVNGSAAGGICIAGDVCAVPLTSSRCDGESNCFGTGASSCSGFPGNTALGSCGAGGTGVMQGAKKTCDRRTAGMIAANCGPCGSTSAGKVVTVTDNLLVQVSKTISV
jgi:hypothetical protein